MEFFAIFTLPFENPYSRYGFNDDKKMNNKY